MKTGINFSSEPDICVICEGETRDFKTFYIKGIKLTIAVCEDHNLLVNASYDSVVYDMFFDHVRKLFIKGEMDKSEGDDLEC